MMRAENKKVIALLVFILFFSPIYSKYNKSILKHDFVLKFLLNYPSPVMCFSALKKALPACLLVPKPSFAHWILAN